MEHDELSFKLQTVAFQPESVGSYLSGDLRHSSLRIRAQSCDVQLDTDLLWLPERNPTIKEGDETEHESTARGKGQKEPLATRIRIQ